MRDSINSQLIHLTLFIVVFLQGCASVYKPQNTLITKVDPEKGYHLTTKNRKPQGDHLVMLSFSGGGTRAAALSYGVLQELRDTTIESETGKERLLDEVDSISSVSGGSFTAAYYGLFGDDIFKNYENDFLNQSVQGTLIRKLFNPVYWWRSMFTGFDRTEMAVEYYDQNIFHGKTFSDIPIDKRPFIEINATDLSTGARFSFTQGMFDIICSDLGSFPVARAVTASSAVPVAFPPIVLKNHAGQCDMEKMVRVQSLLKKDNLSNEEKILLERYNKLQDTDAHTYLHLVDGGISDNLGLRAIMDRVIGLGGIVSALDRIDHPPKDVLIILVNAEVSPKKTFSQVAEKPSISETVGALSSTQISLYNKDTIDRIKNTLEQYEATLKNTKNPVHFYFVELNFKDFSTPSIKDFFNSLPTTLELDKDHVDALIEGGRKLLRDDPEFQSFLNANHGVLNATENQKPCNRLLNIFCTM